MSGKPHFVSADGPGQIIDADFAWTQVLRRDRTAAFFYAVSTTGVFCRPGCRSRLPLRANVRFFASVAEALAAGFRPCKRCAPTDDFKNLIEIVRKHIEANMARAVSLAELGRLVKLSPFTVQRLFKQSMGVSPLQYQRALRAGSLRDALKQGGSVTSAIYNAGYNSSSRAYEGAQLGMTPARFAQGGYGEQIGYATALTFFGWIVVAATARGLCWLALAETTAEAEGTLRAEFPLATFTCDPSLANWTEAALAMVNGTQASPDAPQVLPLDLRGTAFQLRVWRALGTIPRGETRSYSQLAQELGSLRATRAVARACAANRVALLVPCHRVVGASGALTGYRWGLDRKRQLLEAEGARRKEELLVLRASHPAG